MARKAPYSYLRAATYEVFLGGYSTLKNDHMTFYVRVSCKTSYDTACPVKAEKNISIAVLQNIPFSNLRNLNGNGKQASV